MKKAAALLISLIIISSLGLLALIVVRQALSGLIATTRIADEIIADEAAYSGIEFVLKNQTAAGNGKIYRCPRLDLITEFNPSPDYVGFARCAGNSDGTEVSESQFNQLIRINSGFTVQAFASGANRIIDVTGAYGESFKKHRFVADSGGNVTQEY